MHAAKLSKSARLSKLHGILRRSKRGRTSLEIQRETGSMAVHTDIAELRANGVPVGPAKYEGHTIHGRKVYRYTLVEA